MPQTKDENFRGRMAASARDFVTGVQSALEKRLRITIHPIEDLQSSELIKNLDQRGIDAFYYDTQGDVRGLASRMNYTSSARNRPAFTFRYKLWDEKRNCWDDNREYALKLHAANSPNEFILFPKIHVESYSQVKGSGLIGWSFAAQTKDLMNFIQENLDNPEKIRISEPTIGERRQVIHVEVDTFAKDNSVIEIDCSRSSKDNSKIASSPTELRIRPLTEHDADEFYRFRLFGLEQNPQAFGEDADEFRSSTIQQIRERILRSFSTGGIIHGAFDGKVLIGTVCFARATGQKLSHRGRVWGVFVDPKYRRRGVASSLMKETLLYIERQPQLTQIELSVNSDDEAAYSFYKRFGFEVYGRDPRKLKIGSQYYDEYLMIYHLRS